MNGMQTPRRLGARPSLGQQNINTASSPNLAASASIASSRKASLIALTGTGVNGNKMGGGDGREVHSGDSVNVPGGMTGVAKYIGSIAGKAGVFMGVELDKQYASKGKNDGDVDG